MQIILLTDDKNEAFNKMCTLREKGDLKVDMARVRDMDEPPNTIHKYCVFRR